MQQAYIANELGLKQTSVKSWFTFLNFHKRTKKQDIKTREIKNSEKNDSFVPLSYLNDICTTYLLIHILTKLFCLFYQ